MGIRYSTHPPLDPQQNRALYAFALHLHYTCITFLYFILVLFYTLSTFIIRIGGFIGGLQLVHKLHNLECILHISCTKSNTICALFGILIQSVVVWFGIWVYFFRQFIPGRFFLLCFGIFHTLFGITHWFEFCLRYNLTLFMSFAEGCIGFLCKFVMCVYLTPVVMPRKVSLRSSRSSIWFLMYYHVRRLAFLFLLRTGLWKNSKIRINHDSISGLRKIIHVDFVRSREILCLRVGEPFCCYADLKRVNGLNDRRIADIISSNTLTFY